MDPGNPMRLSPPKFSPIGGGGLADWPLKYMNILRNRVRHVSATIESAT